CADARCPRVRAVDDPVALQRTLARFDADYATAAYLCADHRRPLQNTRAEVARSPNTLTINDRRVQEPIGRAPRRANETIRSQVWPAPLEVVCVHELDVQTQLALHNDVRPSTHPVRHSARRGIVGA